MSVLPKPSVTGPDRLLNDALHDLHHRAGWPSLRTLAKQTGVSHTTVSKALSSPGLPSWGTVELLVEAMGGDTSHFQALWVAASTPSTPSAADQLTACIAGRTSELAAVRRHLETGGLMLVTGEAGIGKTSIVAAAVRTTEAFVASGHCVPLSTQVPLLPFVDALRSVHAVDDGQWMKDALADCPPYVRLSLSRLLPALAPDQGTSGQDDPWAIERLFSSIIDVLQVLATTQPLALHLEDCHWADRSTLDLLSHMTTRRLTVPVVATWRTGDPEVPPDHDQWLSRTRWSTGVSTIDLTPLTRDETAQQLRLLLGPGVDDDVVSRIHAQSQGLPLYTSQLASATPEVPVPEQLADLLDQRLGDMGSDAWQVTRALGLAQKPMHRTDLLATCELGSAELDGALRLLTQRRIVRRTSEDRAGLVHPLFAEAISRRLLPGEEAMVHGRLAATLAGDATVEPGVVAAHWRAAGRPDLEAASSLAAARQAGDRLAYGDELRAWLRVLELWDCGHRVEEVELWDVLCRAVGAAILLADYDQATLLMQRALALELPDPARAAVVRRAGELLVRQGETARGEVLLEEALALLGASPPSPELVDLLDVRIGSFVQAGKFSDARADVQRALESLSARDDRRQRRRILNWSSWLMMCAGDHEGALVEARTAQAIELDEPDPIADVSLTINTTDILLHAAAPAAAVEDAARHALREVEDWSLQHTFASVLLRCNVALAHLRAGDVHAARRSIEPVVHSAPSAITAPAHATLAGIELREGNVASALQRCAAAQASVRSRDQNWTEGVPIDADVSLWAGRVGVALALVDEALPIALVGESSRMAAPILCVAARAHADHLDSRRAGAAERLSVRDRLRRLAADALIDPFGDGAPDAAVPAMSRSWHAELARIDGSATVEDWARAADEWERIRRPHDTAYCRWRAALLALRGGRGTIAARLLARAAVDAQQHLPLSDAIAATRAGT